MNTPTVSIWRSPPILVPLGIVILIVVYAVIKHAG